MDSSHVSVSTLSLSLTFGTLAPLFDLLETFIVATVWLSFITDTVASSLPVSEDISVLKRNPARTGLMPLSSR